MDDDLETGLVRVRADTRGFASDVDAMRSALEGPLGDGAERAGRAIETALTRAVRTGRLGFEDLQRVAATAMADIARSAVSSGLGPSFRAAAPKDLGVAVCSIWLAGCSTRRSACQGARQAGRWRVGAATWSGNVGRNCSCRRVRGGSNR